MNRGVGSSISNAVLLICLWFSPVFAEASNCVCDGDCDGDARVTVSELVLSVGIVLDVGQVDMCEAADSDGDGKVAVDEVVRAVQQGLTTCRWQLELACPCERNLECASGHCGSGSCCEEECVRGRCDVPTREGRCTPVLANGSSCVFDRECLSEVCLNGICCNMECPPPSTCRRGNCVIR